MTMLGIRCLLARTCSKPAFLCVIEQANVTQSSCAVDRQLISTSLSKLRFPQLSTIASSDVLGNVN